MCILPALLSFTVINYSQSMYTLDWKSSKMFWCQCITYLRGKWNKCHTCASENPIQKERSEVCLQAWPRSWGRELPPLVVILKDFFCLFASIVSLSWKPANLVVCLVTCSHLDLRRLVKDGNITETFQASRLIRLSTTEGLKLCAQSYVTGLISWPLSCVRLLKLRFVNWAINQDLNPGTLWSVPYGISV